MAVLDRLDLVLIGQGVFDICGEPIGLHCLRIEVELDLARLASIGEWNGGPADSRQLRTYKVL